LARRNVEREATTLGGELQRIADAARPHYEALVRYKLA
jgi:hypothetical protein